MKKFLLVALFAMAVVPRPAEAAESCQPYPECCAWAPNPWQCLAGEPLNGPVGQKCAFNSATDVSAEAGHQTGAWRPGVLVTLEAGRLHCSIHVNNNTHDGAPAADPSASIDYLSTGDAVVIETAAPLNYAATAADTVSACTEWYPANGDPTLYWVSPNPLVPTDPGHWDTSASSPCGEALSIEPNDPECRVWKSVDNALGTTLIEDTWQDCEPYPPLI